MSAPTKETHFTRRSLVVGGAGFLGSHICERLIREGHEVFCVDNLATGREENIQHLLSNPRFHFIRHDVTRPIALPSVIQQQTGTRHLAKMDYILHLALPGTPGDYGRHRLPTLKAGALSCYHTVGLAKEQASVFLLASSPEPSGDDGSVPNAQLLKDTSASEQPAEYNDEPKRFAESIAIAYHREHNVQVRIARIGETYGDRMRLGDGSMLPAVIVRALQGKTLTIYGDGSHVRNFCYVDDMVEGLYKLLLSQESSPVTLSYPEGITIRQMVETVVDLTGSKSRVVFKPFSASSRTACPPDISRAQKTLGWQPQTSFPEGIKRVIPYFRAELADRWLHHPEPGWRSPFQGLDERYVQNN